MKYIFFFQCDYGFHNLPLRHAYLTIYYTCCFWNHYTALMIDTLSSTRVGTARLTILDRRAIVKTYLAFAENYFMRWNKKKKERNKRKMK